MAIDLLPNLTPISIHALREEGDPEGYLCEYLNFISIHALREEGDRWMAVWLQSG